MKKFLLLLAVLIPLVACQPPLPPPPPPPPSCEGVPDHTFIASPVDCAIYFECIEGEAFQLQCPRGTFFSTIQQTCVSYDDSDCPLLPPPTPPIPTCDDVPDFGFIPSLEACDFYYQCFEGEQFLLKCPRGFYFSFERQNCVRPDESDCPLIQPPPPTPPTPPTGPPPTGPPPRPPRPTCSDVNEFGLVPSRDNCALYFMCLEEEQFLLECPRGFWFNFATQNCVRADDSDCFSWDDMNEI